MAELHKAEAAAREALAKYWDGDEMSGIGAAVDDLLAALDAARGRAAAYALPKALAETRADGFTVVRAGHQHHADGTYCVPMYLAPPAAEVPEGLRNAEQTLALLIRKYGDEADAAALAMLAQQPAAAVPEPAFRLTWRDGQYRVSKPNIGDTDCYTAEQVRAMLAAANKENNNG